MTRKQALVEARIAGYHDDQRRGTRVLVESRISRADYSAAFEQGKQQRKSGIACGCASCSKENRP